MIKGVVIKTLMTVFQEYFYDEVAVWQLRILWHLEEYLVYKQFNCVCHLENSSPYMSIFLNVFG